MEFVIFAALLLSYNLLIEVKTGMDKNSLYEPLIQNLIAAFGERLKSIVLFGSQARSKTILKRKRVGKEWYWKFEKTPQKNWELTWEGFRELP
ncbi:MAG: hypothetical protein HUU32_23505 [Calditrichaceae bacterium]|nr:hypothetical protein [Calditrichaceae bacterium]